MVFLRLGFFIGQPIGKYSLLISFVAYVISLLYIFINTKQNTGKNNKNLITSLGTFTIFSIFIFGLSYPMAETYDTSWDGQGYHQVAVIALKNGWNPARDSGIILPQNLPGQVFAEGYPSALWEIQSSIYSFTDKINSAKITNLFILVVSFFTLYSLLRKISLQKKLSVIISIIITLQPIFILQMLTFMEDGFGYQLLVAAVAALFIVILFPKEYWSYIVFIFAELLLVTTKYNNLGLALVLGIIFFMQVTNQFMNKEFKIDTNVKITVLALSLVTLVFAYIPYARNIFIHKYPFYPINIPELMGSVKYNNIPNNLSDNKLSLLLYGIFSKSQMYDSGNVEDKSNIAELKIPFTFSIEEVKASAILFNNRVGAGGPLYSGIFVLSFILLFTNSFAAYERKKRYTIYTSFFATLTAFLLALLTPTPNLLRYASQLQLIPFLITIPLYLAFKNKFTKVFTTVILSISLINVLVYALGVGFMYTKEANRINEQLSAMRNSGKDYQVGAQYFYSNYILLVEQDISFVAVDNLQCNKAESLVSSSTTTRFCEKL